jgi:hypothetical protein
MILTRHRFKERLEDLGLQLPERVCVLDIELESGDVRKPELCVPSIVGVLPFVLKRGSYEQEHPIIVFLRDKEHYQFLEEYLARFPGIIIGHNLLGFDFLVLKERINVKPLIRKSVDTLALLSAKKTASRWGLGLDNLARQNLGKRKTLKPTTISNLWNSGRWNEVIGYNYNDCVLTVEIWFHMIRKRIVCLDRKRYPKEWQNFRRKLAIFNWDLAYLVGKQRPLTYATWVKRAKAKQPFVDIPYGCSFTH